MPPTAGRGRFIIWMDEFYTGAWPQDTEKVMGVIRSRNISMVPILQSVAQIKTLFTGDKWQTIMDNCWRSTNPTRSPERR